MNLKSLIHIPLGYCRLNQRYTLDLKDFLMVEILLCILIIIMAKGIFEMKLSKLQFAIAKTENAARYLSSTKEDFVRRNEFFSRRFNFQKSLPKKTSQSSELEKAGQRSLVSHSSEGQQRTALGNAPSTVSCLPKGGGEQMVQSQSTNSTASEVGGSGVQSGAERGGRKSEEGEGKKGGEVTSRGGPHSATECFSRGTWENLAEPGYKSTVSSLEKDKVNSTGTFTVKCGVAANGDQNCSSMSKMSRSVPQVLNSTGSLEVHHSASVSSKANAAKGLNKSLSQGLGSNQKATPMKALRTGVKSVVVEKTLKSKSQDLRGSQGKS